MAVSRDDLRNPYWIEQLDQVGTGPRKNLRQRELRFWNEMIHKYLTPLEKDKEKEKQAAAGLKELRNQAVFNFLIINSVWVVIMYLLQENKDKLYVAWPIPSEGPIITFVEEDNTVILSYKYLQLEPLGLFFLGFYAIVMFLQLVGMLLHRIMTLGHVVSTTPIPFYQSLRKSRADFDANEALTKHGVDMIREWQANHEVWVRVKMMGGYVE